MAKQAAGSCLVQYGETVVLVAAATGPARVGGDFFPLTCDYRERVAAAGKFPGGFLKREGRPTTKEILTARLMDRPIRPQFPEWFLDEIQIQSFVLASDRQNDGDILAMNGASAALTISPLPFQGPLGSVRLAYINGEFIVFPSHDELEESDLDLIVSGSKDAILMIEGFARELPESLMTQAIATAHGHIREICDLQIELAQKMNVVKAVYAVPDPNPFLETIRAKYFEEIKQAKRTEGKQARAEAVSALKERAKPELIPVAETAEKAAENKPLEEKFSAAWQTVVTQAIRELILSGTRPDGRDSKTLRPITCSVDVLPRVHGSAVFQRGETQALVTVTLGTGKDEQRVDGLVDEYAQKFMLHYYFPSFSVGEVRPIRGPGRREIGHGALAERSVKPVLPPAEDFPYTIRIISDILESNGSSSMATVCGSTLGLMAAGVPISNPVAGISDRPGQRGGGPLDAVDRHHRRRGPLRRHGFQGGRHAERHHGHPTRPQDQRHQRGDCCGHVDAGPRGPHRDPAEDADGDFPAAERDFRLGPAVAADPHRPGEDRSLDRAGRQDDPRIQDATGASIEVEDDGTVTVASSGMEGAEEALRRIESLTATVEMGRIYTGRVSSIKDFGAFIEILPGKDGLCHISELAEGYVSNVGEICKVGDEMPVKVILIDDQDRVKLSRKAALKELDIVDDKVLAGGERPPREGGDRDRDRGDRGGDRGGDRDRGRRRQWPRTGPLTKEIRNEIRISKSETNKNSNTEIQNFGHSYFEFVSDFVFRSSDFPLVMSSDAVNQKLVDQYTEIARLAGGLAHEIKNPLSTIRLNMELLAEDFRTSEAPRDRRAMRKIELVERECQRLQDLLDGFLDFAKVRRLKLEPSDLNVQVAQVLDFFRPKAVEGRIEVVDYLSSDLATVLLDRESFHGALLNLMLNAQQAMPDGGQLVIRTSNTAQGVALDLIDTGCGMDAETQAHAFDAFYSTKKGGSGLGLPTTRKIIEAHGGRISVQSEPGRGTQFTISLPVPRRLPGDGVRTAFLPGASKG